MTADIIFLPVQTPHDKRFEGDKPLPKDRADFDYLYLKQAVEDLSDYGGTLAVISTCLPGTYKREIKPIPKHADYVYTPQFIAMGTVLEDYLNPEFNLIGVDSEDAADKLEEFYSTINDAPSLRTDITTAEGIKVFYNTIITAKTVLANSMGEMSERLEMNYDDIYKAIDLSTKRLLSSKYLDSGMSDGGGCHPRDNIALSHIAKQVGMSHNIWEDLMEAREATERWHAEVAKTEAEVNELPLYILGRSFKPETNIETGSPAKLMAAHLGEFPRTHLEDSTCSEKAVYFIATKHQRYQDYDFPKGSVSN
jgi:Predicted UDP-glucose 6-dehydrogenase